MKLHLDIEPFVVYFEFICLVMKSKVHVVKLHKQRRAGHLNDTSV